MVAKKNIEEIKLNKFERARILGSRSLQIFMGAPFTIKLSQKELAEIGYNPIEIAKKELEAGTIPIDVLREVSKPGK